MKPRLSAMSIKIEDGAAHVLRKAMLGRGVASRALAESTGVPLEKIRLLRRGGADAETRERLAAALGLNAARLRALDEKRAAEARGSALPEPPFPPNLFRFVMPCGIRALPTMSACAYVAADFGRGNALLFDCGMNGAPLVRFLRERRLTPRGLCLTHAHFDHSDGAREVLRAFPRTPVFSHAEIFGAAGAERFSEEIAPADFRLCAVAVPGHTPDSAVFVWENPPAPFPPVAFTGDALFLGSVGGCLPGDLEAALANVRARLFGAFPPETLVAPGHGPATTLAAELAENPFF
ncbi:MAG: MBL fold metallo-hydrolase [Candidatus Spyradosoma sp.]